MSDSRIATIARLQLGLVTQAQIVDDLGVSSHTIHDWVRHRRLEPTHRGVYRIAGAPRSWEQDLLAVCLAGGPTTHVAFRAAAALQSIAGVGTKIVEVTQSSVSSCCASPRSRAIRPSSTP